MLLLLEHGFYRSANRWAGDKLKAPQYFRLSYLTSDQRDIWAHFQSEPIFTIKLNFSSLLLINLVNCAATEKLYIYYVYRQTCLCVKLSHVLPFYSWTAAASVLRQTVQSTFLSEVHEARVAGDQHKPLQGSDEPPAGRTYREKVQSWLTLLKLCHTKKTSLIHLIYDLTFSLNVEK